ncbi:ABC transporter ATP-binding protein [Heliophilum fasciatum]|uniref:NitT/TauT family transport system ATP-binding protein/sulfonate transport system ATP-binding protein n=1 Tax=Heliophilum fasciatum TaxID=35700 RepID=A0A4R2RPI6_9FIRM|nr:ABC transporter ATP-binding protein [Heliophilum fasciatum]MCW2277677.1 NitT/TauT family transport system ATP-binding protein/sulfonate transport system ATP-binding protein [Heliophilum fasciatum]TCP65024.1 NitT/TauT family transport system ATP-binding protein/sulfonate transport system ATP-binding protein [Heliophilum fasciatum]
MSVATLEQRAVSPAAEEAGRIVVKDVNRIFRQEAGPDVIALDQVNLEIEPGKFYSLLGPSGCGKSTLLRNIAGLDHVTSGEITLDGEVIDGPHFLRGLVFQQPTLFPWKTIEQNVATGLEARGILKEKGHEVQEYIRLVGLEGFEKVYPHQVSGGMAQRASLARALVNHPKVLLMDEPLGALDAFTRMQMQEEILRIWQDRGTTIVFVTHDIDEAVYLSDKIVIMTPRPGKIQEVIDVPIGRPRNRNHPDFWRIRSHILKIFGFSPEHAESYQI